MIKKLQRKFIAIAMLSMIFVTVGIAGTINIVNKVRINSEIDILLEMIANNNGTFPEYPAYNDKSTSELVTQETEHSIRYFSVKVDSEDKIIESNLQHIVLIQENQLQDIIKSIQETGDDSGTYENFKYLVSENDGYKLIVFIDITEYMRDERSISMYSIIITLIAVAIVFLLVSVLSRRAIKPVLENMKRQKEFITNAGHELKTPVAIILANAEVLELQEGNDNEWVESIKKQANRLDILIKKLLKLAKMEEKDLIPVFEKFSLSNLIEETADSFKVIAKENIIKTDIMPNVEMDGDEDYIHELISILLDNAIKYVTDDGTINVKMVCQNKNIKIDISNKCETLTKEDCERFFERFYRKDDSRNRKTGGYGIGLSMASSIVKMHKGKIKAEYSNNMIHIIVNFKV